MAFISTGSFDGTAIALPAGYLDFQLRVRNFAKSGGFDLRFAFDAESAVVLTGASDPGEYLFCINPGATGVKAGILAPGDGAGSFASATGRKSSITFSITGETFTGTYILTGIADPA